MKYKNVDVPALAGAFTPKKKQSRETEQFCDPACFSFTRHRGSACTPPDTFFVLVSENRAEPGSGGTDFYFEDYLMESFAS